ncbi:MAG TPA: type IV pilus biogenesis protein PilM [Albitalea sp.]|uniref:type IV pilus biogenesis protein PilM n=1 Tax=Piscinibacter sp. TaxID=1903157 RepID=UPI002ED41485
MWIFWILTAMISLTGYFAMGAQGQAPELSAAASADLARNMSVYRAAVLAYAAEHPAHSGAVPDSVLVFPSWYRRHPAWASIVDGRTVVVFATQRLPGDVVSDLMVLARNSLLVGVADAQRRVLVSPLHGDTALALPPGVPDGVPVWLGMVG